MLYSKKAISYFILNKHSLHVCRHVQMRTYVQLHNLQSLCKILLFPKNCVLWCGKTLESNNVPLKQIIQLTMYLRILRSCLKQHFPVTFILKEDDPVLSIIFFPLCSLFIPSIKTKFCHTFYCTFTEWTLTDVEYWISYPTA